MPHDYANCRDRLFNRPLMVTPNKAEAIVRVLADRACWGPALQRAGAYPPSSATQATGRSEGRLFDDHAGIAIIPVHGTLVQRNGLDPASGMTGYDGIRVKFEAALADPSVRAIVFDVDSPGGEVPGCFDLADTIYAARGIKPMWSILTEHAASAAFALASQADRLIVPRTGCAGSVGVVVMHADFSGALDAAGIEITLIHAGAHKVDGHPFEPLPGRVRDDLQAEVEEIRTLFAEAVARGRDMTPVAVMATEARTYTGEAAVNAGFADAVMAPDQAFATLLAALDKGPMG